MLLKKRDVFVEELFLQGFGGGGDNHPATAANGWNQIGEGFAGSRAGFDQGVLAALEGVSNDLGHFKLCRAKFMRGMTFGEQPVGAENIGHGEQWRSRRGFFGVAFGRRQRSFGKYGNLRNASETLR